MRSRPANHIHYACLSGKKPYDFDMSGSNSHMLPPLLVDSNTIRQIKAKARKIHTSQADVVRQSLRIGLPRVDIFSPNARQNRRPKCLAWLDDYPAAKVSARDVKKVLKQKIATRNGLHR